MITEVKTMMILPSKGLRIRSDKFPHKPIPSNVPTRVLKSSYWSRRIAAGDVVIVPNADLSIESDVSSETSNDKVMIKADSEVSISNDKTNSKKINKNSKE